METILTDLWDNIQTYYDSLIALLPRLFIAIIVFIVLLFIANAMRRFAFRRLNARMDDPLLARFLARTIKTTIIIIAFLLVLHIVGLSGVAVGILSTAGLGAFIIGFAFKDIGENFLAGVMLAFNRPFKIGDVVKLDGLEGKVVSLNLRNTQIKTHDGKDVFIPNANIIKNPVINYTIDGFLRFEFKVGLDYEADFLEAIRLVQHTLEKIPGVLHDEKKPSVHIAEPATSTLNLIIYYWIDTFDPKISGLQLKTDVINRVLKALDGAGYYLPADIIELKNYHKTLLNTNEQSNNLKTTAS